MGESAAAAIESAKRMLRGQYASPAELLALARRLEGKQAFDFARRLLARARLICGDEDLLRVEIDQQWALCTYKDPDLPLSTRLDQALAILAGVLQSAEETAARVPAERTAAAARVAQETFGIAGAIWKQRWRMDGRSEHLEKSLEYYGKAYELGPEHDSGYTAVNAAFVLDLLDRRPEAAAIRERVVELLTGRNPPPDDWWTLVTLGEALFGLGRYEEAGTWLRKAAAFEECARGTPDGVQPWQYETTVKQLAELARPGGTADAELHASAAWKVLVDFVGPARAAGVRTAFAGKVGLALSGGGFRASLFHIGVLARLAELDMLRHVEVLSCVSGGSIVGAHYYLEVRKLLERKPEDEITRDDYIDLVRDLERTFFDVVQTNPRMKVFTSLRALLSFARRDRSRTTHLGDVLEADLYARAAGCDPRAGVPLSGLFIRPHGEDGFTPKYDNWRRRAKVPILLLNATTLNTGHNWQFAASWMGESPGRMDIEIDANKRLRRMYYSDAPAGFKTFPLGRAVAASACVPGLFAPLALIDLYPDHTVRLVDGGVHDNQGINGLLEQDCSVLLVSDASGQMTTMADPNPHVYQALGRSNGILTARVREAEHKELLTLRRSALLRGLMFLHLKKDLAIESVDWVGCNDPKERESEGGVPIRPINLTSYGIRADVQSLLANIRTDLDAFGEAEAFALMTSGYRMAAHEFARCVPTYPARDDVPVDWRFLAVEPLMCEPAGSARFVRMLEIGSQRVLKSVDSIPLVKSVQRFVLPLAMFLAFDLLVATVATATVTGWRPLVPFATVVTMVVLGAFAAGLPYRLVRRLDGRYLRAGSLSRVRAEQPTFLPGSRAALVRLERPVELHVALEQLGIAPGTRSLGGGSPVLVVIGGAALLPDAEAAIVGRMFAAVVVPLAEALRATVVDGGSDAGVMRLLGEARAAARARFPLLGVAAAGTVTFPGNVPTNPSATALERHHSHFLIVPGREWGDESPWLASAASKLADGAPVVTLLVNGGTISLRDAAESVRLGRPLVAVHGTGGLADVLAAAHAGEAVATPTPDIAAIVGSGCLHVVDAESPAAKLREELFGLLRGARATAASPTSRPEASATRRSA